jgi:hypothetical protein
MIARSFKFVVASLMTSALLFAATSFAQILSQQLDPASIFARITINGSGNIVSPLDSSSNTVLINIPADRMFDGQTPSVSANGSLIDQDITLTTLNAEGLSFELTDVKLIRSNDQGDILQLEVAVTTTGAIVDGQNVQFRLENTSLGTGLTFGVEVNMAFVELGDGQ